MVDEAARAWNNFILLSDPAEGLEESKRQAAIAALFMSSANNGGLNSFLTCTPELSGAEVLNALQATGATKAAEQLEKVLGGLGEPLPRASSEDRWNALDRLWTDDLDDFDVLSRDADEELMTVLERHVRQHQAYYLGIGTGE